MKIVPRTKSLCRFLVFGALAWAACGPTAAWAQSAVPVRGVVHAVSGAPLSGATVSVSAASRRVETAADGRFQLDLAPGSYSLLVTHAGYVDATQPVEVGTSAVSLDIVLTALARFNEDVTVSAVRAPVDAPIVKSDIPRAEIEARNYGQEIPFLLDEVPSLTQSADSGAQVGYSYIYLRGIPQTRMNVTIDGMPVNEPEDSTFYFSDLGDFANAVDSIQVQRGVGTSTVGAPSFVGSINFASAAFTDRPEAVVRTGAGSFGTERLSVTLNSGIVGQGFKFYAQGATQTSDGFRYHSGVGQKSVYFGAIRESADSFFKVFGFVGHEHTQEAFLAADEAQLAVDLRTNPLTPEERDAFDQRFVTAQYHRALKPGVELAVQGFYNSADGWYTIRDASADPSGIFQYGLSWHNTGASTTFHAASARTDFTWGAYASTFESRHARDIVSGPADYVNHGYKDEFNTFAKFAWSSGRFHALGDAQLRWARFRYAGSLDLGSIDWTFFNPKAGIRYDAAPGVSLFASIGRGGREPGRTDMLQGEDNASVPYDLSAVLPEQVVDGEFGVNLTGRGVTAQVNGYLMSFRHEIAQTGELSEIGLPLRRNVDRSFRRGIEVDLKWHPVESLQIRHTASYSLNRIANWTQFYDVYDAEGNWTGSTSRTLHDVPPYSTPAVLATVSGDYTPTRGATLGAAWKYVGESHLDNTGDPYFIAPAFNRLDLTGLFDLSRALRVLSAAHPTLRVQVNNVFDNRRIFPSGYSYQYFVSGPNPSDLTLEGTRYYYPQATRNFYVGLELRF